MRTRIVTTALLLVFAAPAGATSSQRDASATSSPLSAPERIVVFATGGGNPNGSSFPLVSWHFDLVDRQQQPRGTLEVVGVATGPLPQQPNDPNPPGVFTFVATLADGSVVGQGAFGFGPDAFSVAIVGGTGRYRRARGQARVAQNFETGNAKIVLDLLP